MLFLLIIHGVLILNIAAEDATVSKFLPLSSFWNADQTFSRTFTFYNNATVVVGLEMTGGQFLHKIIFTPQKGFGDPISADKLAVQYYQANSGRKLPYRVGQTVTITSNLTEAEAKQLHAYTFITDYNLKYMAAYDCIMNETMDAYVPWNVILSRYDSKATNGENYYCTLYNTPNTQTPLLEALILAEDYNDSERVLFSNFENFNRLAFPVPGFLIINFEPYDLMISPVNDPINDGDDLPPGAGCLMSGNYPSTVSPVSDLAIARFAQFVNATVEVKYSLQPKSSMTLKGGILPPYYNITFTNDGPTTTEFLTYGVTMTLSQFTVVFSSANAAAYVLNYHAVNFTGTDIPTPHPFSPSAPNQISTTPLTVQTTTSASRVHDCFSLVSALLVMISLISNCF